MPARVAAAVVAASFFLALPGVGLGETTLPRRVATLDRNHPGTFFPDDADRKGRAEAVLKLDRPERRICYRIEFSNFELRNLSIYRDGADENTDYMVKLYDEAPTSESPLRGCVSDPDVVTRDEIRHLKRHPGRFYLLASQYDGDEIAGSLRRLR